MNTYKRKDDNLTVITKAKDLNSYIFVITDKSPKKFRFSLVTRLQNYGLDIIENLYRANYIIIGENMTIEDKDERIKLQKQAMTTLRLLSYMCMLSREQMCITPKQHKVVSDKIFEVQRLLYAWAESDMKRYHSLGIS